MLDEVKRFELVEAAVKAGRAAFDLLDDGCCKYVKRSALAVRVLLDDDNPEDAYKATFGRIEQADWDHSFGKIAAGKEWISIRTGLPSRIVQTVKRFLLESDDVKYWGNAIEPGVIIVSCSGVQPWIDELISKIIRDTYLALIENEVEKTADANPESDRYDGSGWD